MAPSFSQVVNYFKELYEPEDLERMFQAGRPLLQWLPKGGEDSFAGENIQLTVDYGLGAGGQGTNLQNAISRASRPKAKRFVLDPQTYYVIAQIDARSIKASELGGRRGSYLRMKEKEINDKFEVAGYQLAQALVGDGSGNIGTISSIASTDITLDRAEDAINFHEGMVLQSESTGGTLRNSGATMTVTKVDDENGVITVDAVVSGTVATDLLLVADSQDAVVTGLDAWIPKTTPGPSDSFFGVNRSDRPSMLAGHRQSWLGTIEETAKRLDARMRRFSAKGLTAWVSYENFNQLDNELGARGRRDANESVGEFGLTSITMTTPGGGVTFVADPFVPNDVGYLLDRDAVKIYHLGGLPHVIDEDGLQATRSADGSFDGVEMRWRYWAEFGIEKPYRVGRFEIK